MSNGVSSRAPHRFASGEAGRLSVRGVEAGSPLGRPPLPRSLPRSLPGLVLAAIVIGAAIVVLLWWHDTPPIRAFGDWLTNAGRITGLLAGYVIVVLLLLMARVPILERELGADRLARWHSMGGRYTVNLSVAHTLLIIWGYAVSAHEGLLPQTGQLLTQYPDVMMATVGLGLLVLVGVVSMRAARKRMRYETWYYLHFYTYLAIAITFSHEFSTGADFVSNLKARVLWSALYIGAAVVLLWYRFVVPVRSAVRHRMTVSGVFAEAPGIYSIHLAGHHLDDLQAQPGQFFRWRFLTRGEWWQSHPYSLSAPASDRLLRITVKALGDHSLALQRIRPGTKVFAEGPYGALTRQRRTRPKVLLLAGGIGITPLRALFETIPAEGRDLTLVYRANSEIDVVFRSELDAIARWRGARVVYLVGPPASENDPFVGRRMQSVLPDIRDHDVYLCGPPRMMDAAREALRRVGVRSQHIHAESFEF
ncbi:MAG: ferredoxin reductase family protein [Acidothermaceae bacterium]